jgi:hypothetical protein
MERYFFSEESSYLMILKGSQIIDLSPDGSGRAGQLASVVGVQGDSSNHYKLMFFPRFYYLLIYKEDSS